MRRVTRRPGVAPAGSVGLENAADRIAHAAEGGERPLVGARDVHGIIETPVAAVYPAGKNRTAPGCAAGRAPGRGTSSGSQPAKTAEQGLNHPLVTGPPCFRNTNLRPWGRQDAQQRVRIQLNPTTKNS